MKLIECVPNFSEGRNPETIQAIAQAIDSVKEVNLLNVDAGYDANRTVYTFVGTPEGVSEAAFNAFHTASSLIDMRYHKGEHPRLGSCDVFPFVPIQNIAYEEVNHIANKVAEKVSKNLSIPIYLYEKSSKLEYRKRLEQIRKGEYEGLESKLMMQEWKPDYGSCKFNPKHGATVLGVRDFLIAYNVNICSDDKFIAGDIARKIRESGYVKEGERVHGLYKNLKAIGWYMEEYKCAQVSTNITNYLTTPILDVYNTIRKLAEEHKVKVMGSELVGLIPIESLLMAGRILSESSKMKELLESASEYLGLNSVKSFNVEEQILEIKAGLKKL